MKIKDTQYVEFLRKTLDGIMDERIEIQQEENAVKERLKKEVDELVNGEFRDFKDGELVTATWLMPSGPYDVKTTRKVFFHRPSRMSWLSGTNTCDYEIRFRPVNKDGSECKRDNLVAYHVPISRLVSIEKI